MDSYSYLDRLINYGTVAIGLGFVIFIHELGHFLLAKWNGVKVEKFAIGFDLFGLRLFSRRYGETVYVLGAIPLGGYVKMLGEGDDANPEAEKTTDPRAYPNKSVGARMSIISAGVVMNLILGVLCFIYVYSSGGLPVTPAKLGYVSAVTPAFEAGLRPGDEIVGIDGAKEIDFTALRRMTALSAPGAVLHLEVKRPGKKDLLRIDVRPRREPGRSMKTMGVSPIEALNLAYKSIKPFEPLAGMDPNLKLDGLKPGDRVVAAGPEGQSPVPVADFVEWEELLSRDRDLPLLVVVERPGGEKGASPIRSHVAIPAVPFVTPGFRLTPGPVKSVADGSPAAAAGFLKGDRIVGVDGAADYDPMRLPDLVREKAGSPVVFTVERAGGKVVLTATPEPAPVWTDGYDIAEPLKVPGLGLAMAIEPRIAAVTPGGPAARAGLKAGDVIDSVTLTPRPLDKKPAKPITRVLDGKAGAWPNAFLLIQHAPRQALKLNVKGRKTPIALTPEPDPAWHIPDRGLQFTIVEKPLPPMSVADAIRRGVGDTRETILSIYQMLRSLFTSEMSTKELGGALTIADMASNAADTGLVTFLHFIGMLSINLAVINFLPIPVLDGGQMVFLLAEKVRGRPLPERVQAAGLYFGILVILGLMVFVLGQDFLKYVLGYR